MKERVNINKAILAGNCKEVILILLSWHSIWKAYYKFINSTQTTEEERADIKNRVLIRILEQCKKGKFRIVKNEAQLASFLKTLGLQVLLKLKKENSNFQLLGDSQDIGQVERLKESILQP